jgi:integrase
MASIQPRPRADGTTAYAVLFRMGKKQPSRTFEDEASAQRFVRMIDDFGAERALRYLEDEADVEEGLSLDELAQRWLASKEGDVTPNILVGYRRDYGTWIKPRFGHREAAHIHEGDVQAWVDWMKVHPSPTTGAPLSPKSIADRHAILHQIYGWGSARTRNLVPHNPCKETELPKRKKTPPKGLRIPELHALLRAGAEVDQDAVDLVAFMAGTGWRIGESVAVLAGAIEDYGDDPTLPAGIQSQVYVNMDRVLRRGVGFTEGGKSDAAMRRIQVLGPAVAMIRRRLVGLGPNDFLFTFADGRPGVNRRGPWNVNSFRDLRWPRLVEAAGLTERHPTPHWLRHTHVAVCIAAGLSLAEIQRRLGHEDIQTTINVYGRMFQEMNAEAAGRLAALLTPVEPQLVQGDVVPGELTPPGSA